jgi:signal transduction histidine kinase
MTDSLLEVARYGEGKLTLDETAQPAADLVHRVARSMRSSAEQNEHAFNVDVDVPDGLTLHTDTQKLEQVLSNLVSNAIKYTPRGGTIDLTATANDRTVTFAVADTGRGIPESVQDELFQAYERGDAETRSDSTGLGLWICRTFTDALGGRIEVDSTPGAGSTFRVLFPRDAVTDSRASVAAGTR